MSGAMGDKEPERRGEGLQPHSNENNQGRLYKILPQLDSVI